MKQLNIFCLLVSRWIMNVSLTDEASLAMFSGGVCERKPILLPNIKVQTASSAKELTIFSKFLTFIVSGSRFKRSSSMKSSHIQFNAGKNDFNTLGLLISLVSLERKYCQDSPCLK